MRTTTARNPRPGNYTVIGTDSVGNFVDFRNNVVYNWASTYAGYNDDSTMLTSYNIVGNAYISGSESAGNFAFREGCRVCNGYFADNSINGIVPADPWSTGAVPGNAQIAAHIAAYKARSAPVTMPPVTTTSPRAGVHRRARVGRRVHPEARHDRPPHRATMSSTGPATRSTPPCISPKVHGRCWRRQRAQRIATTTGCRMSGRTPTASAPSDPADRNAAGPGGYTQLETYLNSLVGEVITTIPRGTAPACRRTSHCSRTIPNPFNPHTVISYRLPAAGHATLTVYDGLGRTVKTLVNGRQDAGVHDVIFDGAGLAAGVYYYRLQAGGHQATKALLLMK